MGIELPDELAEVAAAIGAEWPEADEDALLEQAAAWREAERQLGALAGEADTVAAAAIASMTGAAGELADQAWKGFADPDSGQLAAAVRGAGEAAARLEHAAAEVGAAKVEMVRQLVDAAKNHDAALAVSNAGHPAAALGVETVITGASANLAAVSDRLTASIGPGGGAEVATMSELVDVNPGLSTVDTGDALDTGDTAADGGTGPIALPPGEYQGLLPGGGFDDVPTPPSGLRASLHTGPIGPLPTSGTTAAGFSDGPVMPAQPSVHHQPAFQPPPQPYAPPPYQPPPGYPGAYRWGGYPVGQQPVYAPLQPYPPQPVQPVQQPLGAPRKERESIVALFLVHMFPIGHLPVASGKPALQLGNPDEERNFPPHDHPDSTLIDSAEALSQVTAGLRRQETPSGRPPAAVADSYDPDARPAQPPELSDPVVLTEGVQLDRFGPIEGRVFAQDGTPFGERALTPDRFSTGYRRYRVRRELPMWRSGTRFRALYSADELVTLGYLADITFEEQA